MKLYSEDFKEASLRHWSEFKDVNLTIEAFKVSYSTLFRWRKQYETEGHLQKKPRFGRPREIDDKILFDYIKVNSDLRLQDMMKLTGFSENTVRDALKRLKITYKKRPHFIRKDVKKKGWIIKKK